MRPPLSTRCASASPGRVIRPRLGDVRNAFWLTAATAVSHACGVRAHHAHPAGQPFSWLRFLHQPLAAAGLLAIDPSAWPLYLTVLIILTCEWPFHLQLAEGIEIYPPAEWTSASAAYVLGFAVLPVFWLSATLGFGLIVLLDGLRLVPASGIAADSVRWVRGRAHPPGVVVDGDLRGFVNVSTHAVPGNHGPDDPAPPARRPAVPPRPGDGDGGGGVARRATDPGSHGAVGALAPARGRARLGHARRDRRAAGAHDLL